MSADLDYSLYRGKCKEFCEAAIKIDPTLKLIRGHYYCPIWNSDEPHWWTVRENGDIYDPTRMQFPSRGLGVYIEFDGYVECSQCGKIMNENDAKFESNYCFCSSQCYGRFIGVY